MCIRDRLSTVCMQNAVTQHQMGVATGAANFFRSLFSALVVAVLGAIVLGGLGGVTGMSIEMLARAASANELSFAFRFVFMACALVLTFGMAFLIAMEQRPLKGPAPPSGGAGPFSGRCSIAIRNAMPKVSTSAQARNTKRNA